MIRTVALVFTLLAGCGTKANPHYCDETTPCAEGLVCDLIARECQPAQPDLFAPDEADLAPESDLSPPEDMSPSEDLQEPDLQPEPDLAPYPDLLPPTPYFWPDVQGIINSVGCAKSGCHNAGDGLYVPFLIPNPSPAPSAAEHQNYTNFSAETEVMMMQKLVNNDGISHGGVTKNSPDRKPCASASTEPCATLERWYAAGMPEIAP